MQKKKIHILFLITYHWLIIVNLFAFASYTYVIHAPYEYYTSLQYTYAHTNKGGKILQSFAGTAVFQ